MQRIELTPEQKEAVKKKVMQYATNLNLPTHHPRVLELRKNLIKQILYDKI